MKRGYLGSFFIFSIILLAVDAIIYFGIAPDLFQASIVGETANETTTLKTEEISLGVPKLVSGVNTSTNRNGATVFYGYKSGDIDTEELLKSSYERRTKNNKSKSIVVPRQRTTNYRSTQLRSAAKNGESFHASAPLETKGVQRGTGLEEKRTVGFQKTVQEKSSRKARISLVQSVRAYGVANAAKNAREKAESRDEWNSKVWAQNRKKEDNALIKKDSSKIQINVNDSRKNILQYYKEMEEFYASPSIPQTEEATPSE